MEEPEIRPLQSPRKEALGEGAADLEKLLQTAEAENLQMVKLIDTERQKHAVFQKQIEETIAQTEALEESTKHLDAEAKQLHNKFKQNREICEGLRKTAAVLDEHEETLRKKLEMVTLQRQTQNLQNKEVVEKYEKTWAKYLKRYESMPLTKELSQIKKNAIDSEMCVKEANDKIKIIQKQIIEMEVEKTHMQEYLQGNPETATECIIKIAKLFLDVEKSATTARQKLAELKDIRAELASATVKQKEKAKAGSVVLNQERGDTMVEQEKLTQDFMIRDDTQVEPLEIQQHQPRPADSSITTDESQALERQTNTSDIPARQNHTTHTPRTEEQMPLIQAPQRVQHGRLEESEDKGNEVITSSNNNRPLLQVTTDFAASSSRQRTEQTESSGNTDREVSAGYSISQPASGPRRDNTTPITDSGSTAPYHHTRSATAVQQLGSATPVNQSVSVTSVNQSGSATSIIQSASATSVNQSVSARSDNQPRPTTPINHSGSATTISQSTVRSPLDFNQHINFITQVSKSPGEGFLYQGRSMYNTNQVQCPEERKETQQQEQESVYEAPLNDQPDMTLNFFQPFNQQAENRGCSLFQTNPEPSPERNTNMFLQSSPANSGTSPRQSFAFGPASPSAGQSSFLSSGRSPGGMFGGNKNQAESDSFSSGFSLFGAGNSPSTTTEDTAGGFSFSFGTKSPSKSSSSSGFCLF